MKFIKFLKSVVWRDLFRHRYGLLVETIPMPRLLREGADIHLHHGTTLAITQLPLYRPLTQSYNEFVAKNTKTNTLFFSGSRSTLKGLGNIGSVLPNNWKQLDVNRKIERLQDFRLESI